MWEVSGEEATARRGSRVFVRSITWNSLDSFLAILCCRVLCCDCADSRAVLCRGGKAVRLTIDHKASLPEEAKRIREAGGFIGRNKRVNGVLAISRALGDHMVRTQGEWMGRGCPLVCSVLIVFACVVISVFCS